MKKVNEFLEKAQDICEKQNTIYLMGGWGHSLTWNNSVNEFIANYTYNKKHQDALKTAVDAARGNNTSLFGFDCCGLIKGIIWGFDADQGEYGGGAVYASNGLPDVNQDGLLEYYSKDVSNDFENIVPGEILYMKGHCGIYFGDGMVIECTPKNSNNVQYSRLEDRKWTKHFKLTVIDYTRDEETEGTIYCPHCGKLLKMKLET